MYGYNPHAQDYYDNYNNQIKSQQIPPVPTKKKLFWSNDTNQLVPYDEQINDLYNNGTLPIYFYIGVHKHIIMLNDSNELIQVKKDPCPQSCPKCNYNTTNQTRHIRQVTVQTDNGNVSNTSSASSASSASNASNASNKPECPICFDAYNNNAYISSCGHSACINCLNRILKLTANERNCPTCRTTLDGARFIRNYSLG